MADALELDVTTVLELGRLMRNDAINSGIEPTGGAPVHCVASSEGPRIAVQDMGLH